MNLSARRRGRKYFIFVVLVRYYAGYFNRSKQHCKQNYIPSINEYLENKTTRN